jgi:uncharacterized protein YndB with AHSA1/START domain
MAASSRAETATATVRVSRVLAAPPERIWRCFVDPDAYAKWLPPHGFTGHVHHMDAKVGGTFRMSFSTINRSWSNTFGGRYVEMKPFESDDLGMQGEMLTTITLRPVPGGTEVTAVQERIPAAAAEGAPIGWGQSLDNLQRLVEQELPF